MKGIPTFGTFEPSPSCVSGSKEHLTFQEGFDEMMSMIPKNVNFSVPNIFHVTITMTVNQFRALLMLTKWRKKK